MTTEFKLKVVDAIKEASANYKSQRAHAVSLGIAPAQYSRVVRGDIDKVLGDGQWVSIARKLDVNYGNSVKWNAANTFTYQVISTHLQACKDKSIALMLCDAAGIGKTFCAKHWVKTAENAVYIDCSQVKSKQQLVRKIALEFGISSTSKYAEVYNDLIFYLKTLDHPIIILDEAGDLAYAAFLELKALYNATEYMCGWYMMGADGFRAKFERGLNNMKVGYSEVFRRYGEKYQRITPQGKDDRTAFLRSELKIVAAANEMSNYQELFAKTGGSLSRLYIENQKSK